MATLQDLMAIPREALNVRRVFGDPIEKGEVTVIPVAHFGGGGGGGEGGDTESGEGTGGGFGLMARPAGVYVISGDQVRWEPALDITLLGLAGIALAALITVTVRAILRHR